MLISEAAIIFLSFILPESSLPSRILFGSENSANEKNSNIKTTIVVSNRILKALCVIGPLNTSFSGFLVIGVHFLLFIKEYYYEECIPVVKPISEIMFSHVLLMVHLVAFDVTLYTCRKSLLEAVVLTSCAWAFIDDIYSLSVDFLNMSYHSELLKEVHISIL